MKRGSKKPFPLYSPPSPLTTGKEREGQRFIKQQGRFFNKFSKTFYFQIMFALMYFQVEYFDQLQFYAFAVVEIFLRQEERRFQIIRVLFVNYDT